MRLKRRSKPSFSISCQRFQARWHEIEKLGFDRRFKRMWEFYLAYCEAGFRSRATDVTQIALVRP